jgi:hypothetical protein
MESLHDLLPRIGIMNRPKDRSAGFPACGFTGLSSPVFPSPELATGKSPEPADKNVCATLRFME